VSPLQAGDVVTIDFPGVEGVKRRPAIVVSSAIYHQHRPDIIVGVVTSQIHKATARDWVAIVGSLEKAIAGLRKASL